MKVNLFFLRLLCVIFIMVAICSCNSTKKPKIQKELAIKELVKAKIVPIYNNYKKGYFKEIHYLFINKTDQLQQTSGDFYNVKYDTSSINVIVSFFEEYFGFKNVIVALLSKPYPSAITYKNLPVEITSTKHGTFHRAQLPIEMNLPTYDRILYVRPLGIDNKYDILEKIRNDAVTVKIGNETYGFINPEWGYNFEIN
ncbi:hypothetical protein [Dokdonia sp. Hel_I_53]|uniref:hypothetical protein n=1 Tax=Dokdonia sp. Hel_I_53 TaxID=1566287 RepID=UPI00119BE3F5|nr:hypothetical protein [Dokdonia sp. Hel_I_53]TVZ52695.1 hypothetical protein OD90_1879 [Dokdonia sp. Hel_I_53]